MVNPTKVTYRDVDQYMRKINERISPLLKKAVLSVPDEDSREIIDYFFAPRYDQPKARPLLCQLIFELIAELGATKNPLKAGSGIYNIRITNNLLVAIRLLDGASILHDDILDHNLLRDGQESVVSKYGYERALIAGEIIRELAYKYFSDAIDDQEDAYDTLIRGERTAQIKEGGRLFVVDGDVPVKRSVDIQRKVTDLFNDIWFKGNIGQLLDANGFSKESNPTKKRYEKRIYLLTGQFFEKIVILGAFDAGIDERESQDIIDALGEFGKYYGMGAQIRNDLLDFVPEGGFRNNTVADRKFSYQDFVEGKQTLPVILAKERLKEDEWRYIFERIGREDLSNEEKGEINKKLVECGAIKDTQKQIYEYSKLALSALSKISIESEKKEMLKVWALALSNMIKRSFAGEEIDLDIRIDSLESLEEYFYGEEL